MTKEFQTWSVSQLRYLIRRLRKRDWVWKDCRCSTRVTKQMMVAYLHEWRLVPPRKGSQKECYRNKRLKLEFYVHRVGDEMFLIVDPATHELL